MGKRPSATQAEPIVMPLALFGRPTPVESETFARLSGKLSSFFVGHLQFHDKAFSERLYQ